MNEGKTGFVRGQLKADIAGTADDVRRAWTKMGRSGTISESLIGKIRTELRREMERDSGVIYPETGPLNADGTLDMRFKVNKRTRIDPERLDRLEAKVDDLFDVTECIGVDQIPALFRQVRRLIINAGGN